MRQVTTAVYEYAELSDKAKSKARSKGPGGGAFAAFGAKFQKIPPEDRARMKTASPEERHEILKKAGFTDDEIEQMRQLRERMQQDGGGSGGPPGGSSFGGPPGGGGFGGPPGGGGGN